MLLTLSSLVKTFKINFTGVIHVGGHTGEELEEYYSKGIDNLIVFEPLPQTFSKLSEEASKYSFKSLQLINKAVGAENKQVEMYVSPGNTECSSILKPTKVLINYPDIDFSTKETVDMVTLDSVISENHNFNFLNIDVQGYELEVLKGAEKTLQNIDYVFTEVNLVDLYEGNPLVEDMDNFLQSCGLVRVKTQWHEDAAPPDGVQYSDMVGMLYGVSWGDAFYIREDLI